ncbi:MAG: sensor histidine kinase [Planctomycetota bacterium]|jgi:signal transduction histidine kinase
MRPANRRAWLGFGAVAMALLAVVSWLTIVLVRLDRDEVEARRQAFVHERLRLALWRMDSWLAPVLAREGLRPASDYRAFPSATTAWTKGFSRLGPNDVVTRSPLLGVESPLFALHFELSTNGLTSPQVPIGNERDVAEANGVDRAVLERATAQLQQLAPRLSWQPLVQQLGGVEAQVPLMGCNPLQSADNWQDNQSGNELANRQRAFVANNKVSQQLANDSLAAALSATSGVLLDAAPEQVGPLLPLWLDGADGPLLVFVRRVGNGLVAGGERVQGMAVAWPALQRELLGLVVDLFGPDASLVRCTQPKPAEQPSMLASLPARLVAHCRDDLHSGLPLGWLLAITWGATLLGLSVLGFTLRAAIGYGDRRARFASAVTHELRTPLTTFRMYSEMLAEGVVTEPTAQREYLQTLQRESDRLARVVENVLAWSRLEEGRFTARRVQVDVRGLLERATPALERRLAEAGLALAVHADEAAAATVLSTDEDAIGQILFNLVDNAAKYARGSSPAVVELRATATQDGVVLAVCDHGPGVAEAHRERIFAPFDRGAVAVSSNEVPGVGLGLALARGLARDLGGELRLVAADGTGACFELRLPR